MSLGIGLSKLLTGDRKLPLQVSRLRQQISCPQQVARRRG
jgi:hypothetical protein